MGPLANVSNAHNQTATFRVPSNITDEKFAFNLTLSDSSGDSSVNTVTFTVQSTAVDIVTIDEIDYSNGKGTVSASNPSIPRNCLKSVKP